MCLFQMISSGTRLTLPCQCHLYYAILCTFNTTFCSGLHHIEKKAEKNSAGAKSRSAGYSGSTTDYLSMMDTEQYQTTTTVIRDSTTINSSGIRDIFKDTVSEEGNAISSVCPSICFHSIF